MKYIHNDLVNKIIAQAKGSSRKRMNYNFHSDLSDPFQRMLNCLEPETYCRPHKHGKIPKREVFIILKGTALVVNFDDNGKIIGNTVLNNINGQYGVEIAPGEWHTILALESGTVVYECKDGPYSPIDDKDFASWAPKEGNEKAIEYNNNILSELGYQ